MLLGSGPAALRVFVRNDNERDGRVTGWGSRELTPEQAIVFLLKDLPEHRLRAGDRGVVVSVHTRDGQAFGYALEVFSPDACVVDVFDVPPDALRKARHADKRPCGSRPAVKAVALLGMGFGILFFGKEYVAAQLNLPVALIHVVAMAGAIIVVAIVLGPWGLRDDDR